MKLDIPLESAIEFYNTDHNKVMSAVQRGYAVWVYGFGKYGSRIRPEYYPHHPITGEDTVVESQWVPTFTFGDTFKRVASLDPETSRGVTVDVCSRR